MWRVTVLDRKRTLLRRAHILNVRWHPPCDGLLKSETKHCQFKGVPRFRNNILACAGSVSRSFRVMICFRCGALRWYRYSLLAFGFPPGAKARLITESV